MIYIGLKRGTGIYSWLIRLWTRSRYSHVGIVYVPNMRLKSDVQLTEVHETIPCFMYEATAKHGVIKRHITIGELADEGYNLTQDSEVYAVYKEEEIIERLERHIGDDYDWLAIYLAKIIPINIQDRRKWFCFEYIAWALGMEKAWRWTGRTFEKFLKI
jgi:hypothetical protein